MRDILTPLWLMMIGTAITEHAQLTINCRREGKTNLPSERPGVGREMIISATVPLGLGVETSVLNVDADSELDIALIRQRLGLGAAECRPCEMEHGGVAAID